MKVKKNGMKPSTWRMDVNCNRCKATIEISYKDIEIVREKKNTFWAEKYILKCYIICPECGEKIEIDERNIPFTIRRQIIEDMDVVQYLMLFYFS